MSLVHLDDETAKKVIRQVEFYFSDSNLPRDRFLKKTIEESEDGLVGLSIICAFSRMRSHLGLGECKADDVPADKVLAVAETLRTSSSLKISEDGKRVGRSTELLNAEEVIEQVDSRTIAASPLPYDVKHEDVESFFGNYGKVNSVRLPRHIASKKLFCGTALVEFSSEEDANKVLKESLIHAGAELELKPKQDFDAERRALIENLENSNFGHGHQKNGRAGGEDNSYPKGLIVSFKLKSMSEDESKGHNSNVETETESEGKVLEEAGKPSEDSTVEDSKKESEDGVKEDTKKESKNEPGDSAMEDAKKECEDGATEEAKKESENKAIEDVNKESDDKTTEDVKGDGDGKTLEDTNKGSEETILREDIKSVFAKFGTVKYVDYTKGAESGYVRFEHPEGTERARAAAVLAEEGGLVVKNHIAILDPVTGDAEKEYWNKVREHQDRWRDSRGTRGRGRGRGRGGRGGKHQRHRDFAHGERPSKAQRV
ncbi:hypothetical protein AMTRI_Chr05g66510 [Amborella trichopoda]